MRTIIFILGLFLLIGGSGLRAERDPRSRDYAEGEAELTADYPETPPSGREPKASPRAPRHRHGDILFRQFRREVREIGEEIRGNLDQIRDLEEKLPALEPGPEKENLEERLVVSRRRLAELRLELARKKVAFTLRALEIAEERYQKALAGLDEVRGIVEAEYPDLADLPPVQ